MNNCGFIGRMGANPSYHPPTNQNGTNSVYTFSLAVKRPGAKKDAQGNMPTDWLNFTAFGKTADLINQYCPKGCLVAVTKSHAIIDEFTDKQSGQQRKAVKFIVDEVDLEVAFASTKGQNTGGQQQGQNNNYQNNNAGNNNYNNNQQNYAQYNQPANVQGNQNSNYNNNNGGYNNNNNAPVNNGNSFGQGRGAAPAVEPYNPSGNVGVVNGGDLPF